MTPLARPLVHTLLERIALAVIAVAFLVAIVLTAYWVGQRGGIQWALDDARGLHENAGARTDATIERPPPWRFAPDAEVSWESIYSPADASCELRLMRNGVDRPTLHSCNGGATCIVLSPTRCMPVDHARDVLRGADAGPRGWL